MNTLETILDEIVLHDKTHPDHGTGCACHDKHAGTIRRLLHEKGVLPVVANGKVDEQRFKSLSNLFTVLGYVQRNP